MGRLNRFVEPKTKRIEISDGDWIEVKEELNVREMRDAHNKSQGDNNALAYQLLLAYLVDWSFEMTNGDGTAQKVEFNVDAVDGLDQDTFVEISNAINRHVEEQNEKKATTGSLPPETT